MEISLYLRLVKRWAWLIILMAFVVGGLSFIIRSRQPDQYEASATIAIGSFIQSPNPDATEIRTGVELAQTYAKLATTYDVLQGTVDALSLSLTSDQLYDMVTTRIVPDTSLLVLTVTYTDPVLVADMANEITRQLVANSPTNLTPSQQNQIDIANAQIERLTQQLEESRPKLESLETQLASAQEPSEIEHLTTQRDTLINQVNQASATIAQFSLTITNLQQRTNSIDVVENARVPSSPSGRNVITVTLLGVVIGVVLGVGAALLIEYLNDTIRNSAEVAQTVAVPVMGIIPRFGKSRDNYSNRLIINEGVESQIVEAYRTLRTNVMFTSEEGNQKVLIVTSPGPSEGKSVTTANLAISLALSGQKVLLIDADLRRPRVHEFFDFDNQVGMTKLLMLDPRNLNNTQPTADGNSELEVVLRQCLKNTEIPRMRVITSGYLPHNPTEMLGSDLMQRWVQIFRSVSRIDVILIDTSPCLLFSDSIMLAASIQSEVMLVINAGVTRRNDAMKARERFQQVGADIKGVILNRVNPREEDYYGYGYGYKYYYSDEPR